MALFQKCCALGAVLLTLCVGTFYAAASVAATDGSRCDPTPFFETPSPSESLNPDKDERGYQDLVLRQQYLGNLPQTEGMAGFLDCIDKLKDAGRWDDAVKELEPMANSDALGDFKYTFSNDIGLIYLIRDDGGADPAKAEHWLRQALTSSSGANKNLLACAIYLAGEPARMSEAFALMREAAEEGNGGAMAELSNYFRHGVGTQPDTRSADEWLAKAVEVETKSRQRYGWPSDSETVKSDLKVELESGACGPPDVESANRLDLILDSSSK